jgi:hypothetical protein
MSKPSTNGTNGRTANGQFAEGNKCGTGNPYARRVAQLRSKMLEAVGAHLDEIVGSMITLARDGDVQATKLILAYSLGKPQEPIHPDLLDAHEKDVQKLTGSAPLYAMDEAAQERVRQLVAAADFIEGD